MSDSQYFHVGMPITRQPRGEEGRVRTDNSSIGAKCGYLGGGRPPQVWTLGGAPQGWSLWCWAMYGRTPHKLIGYS